MIKDTKAKDIESLYKIQKGNIYKVSKKKSSLASTNKKSLLAKAHIFKQSKPSKVKSALDVGGNIYTPTDSSIETNIDPI